MTNSLPLAPAHRIRWTHFGRLAFTAAFIAVVPLYFVLEPIAFWITRNVFGLDAGSHLASAVEFFLYEAPKVLILLTVVVFAVCVLR